MFGANWRRWLNFGKRSQRSAQRSARSRLRLEPLEDRLAPAVSVLSSAAVLSDTAAGNVQGPASVSQDGRFVVFSNTAANLVPGQVMDPKTAADVFLYDRATGTTTLVSHAFNSTTTTADGTSKNAAISADGNWIAYVSNSDNLVSGEILSNDTYTLIESSVTGGTFKLTYGGQTTGAIAYNASALAVQLALTGLAGVGSGNATVTSGSGVYTITFTGALGHGASTPLTVDGSGLTGLLAAMLVEGGHNEFLCDQYWVFLYNVQNGTTTLVSHLASDQGSGYQATVNEGTSGVLTGAQGGVVGLASQTTSVSISGDGSSVVFVSTAAHLVDGQQQGAGITNATSGTRANVFVYDRTSDTNYLVSREDGSPTNGSGAPTTPGDSTSFVAVIDQNGDTIAFTDQSTNLVHNQTINGAYSVGPGASPQYFVAKRSGATWVSASMALASHDLSGATSESITNTSLPLDYPPPALTPDGHWMVYLTVNAIVQNPQGIIPTGEGDNYYLYDTTNPNSVSNNTLITRQFGTTNQEGNAGPDAFTTTTAPPAAVSDNGQYVAFYSAATNLTSTASATGYNVFLFNASTGNLTRITHQSIPTNNFPSTGFPPLSPTISGNDRYVGYVGFATADIAGLTNVNTSPGTKGMDALVYDQNTSGYTLLSHAYASSTTTGAGEAYAPVISNDGSTVVYLDDADNLIPTTINGHTGHDLNAALPADGTDLFAFSLTTPSGYTPQAANGTNATVTLLDPNLASLTANGLSVISPVHAVSNDGRFTVFMSNAPNLIAGEIDTSLTLNVYLFDKLTNTTTLVSHAAGSAATTANGESTNAVISGDGSTVVFYSFATNLIPGVLGIAGTDPQLYLYDVATGALSLVSHTPSPPLTAANGTAPFKPTVSSPPFLYSNTSGQGLALPSISDDGQYIAYLSNATNLSATNPGLKINVFLYDRGADANTLVSHASTSATTAANNDADTVAISADGTTLAFTDKATNLLATATANTADELYVWSRTNNSNTGLSAGQTVLASHTASSNTTAASFGSGTAISTWGPLPPSLSSNGAFVAYYFGGNNLVASQSGTASAANVFRYDVLNNSNTLVSHAFGSATTAGDNPSNANQLEASGPAISADGRFIAYANNSTNLLAISLTGQNGQDNVYLYDANTQGNTLVSHDAGSATTPDTNGGTSPSISSDGRYVSFIDLALNTTADVNCTFTASANVRRFDQQAAGTTQPAVVGGALDPTPMNQVGATRAPTVLSADGSTTVWDGLAAGVTPGDLNGKSDVFLFTAQAAATHFLVLAPTTATAGNTFSFLVLALDQFNNTDTNYTGTVHFTSTDGQAVLPSDSTLTAGTGSFDAILKTAGSQTITATDTVSSSITGTSNSITVSAAAASHFSVSAPSSATAGSAFSFTVTAQDQFNNTATSYTGTVHFTGSDGNATLPGNSPLSNGTGTFSATLRTAGNQTITATDTVSSPVTGTSNAISVSAAAATHFFVSAPASATAGSAFDVTVTAQDQFNNTDTNYSGTVHFTSTDGQAILPADSTLSNGTGTFSATLETAGSQTITATDTSDSSITGTSNTITVSAAAATHFSVSAPGSATAGSAFSFTVTALDQFNNVDTNYGGTVHFTSTDGQAVLPGDTTLSSGTDTFSATLKTAGSQTLTATDTVSSSITGTSNSISVSAAAATHFSVSAPASATAGNAFNFTVTAQDQFNNTDTTYAGTAHFTSSDGNATLPADSTLTNGAGSFSATLTTAGNQTITATDTSDSSITGTSNAIAVSAAAATHFLVSAPSSATAGTAFNVTVTALDQFNNTDTSYGGTVHFTSTDGAAVLPADSTLSNGAGTFSATLKTAGSQTITATDTVTSSITGTSNTIDVTAAAATHFSVSAPGSATAGSAFTLTVTAQDQFNNTDTSYGGTVHFTSSDGQAVLPADSLLSNGTGSFSATLKTAGSQTITATDTVSSSITGTSNSILVSAAAATHFLVSAPSGAFGGIPFNFTVTAQDQFNNTDTSYGGTVHFTSSDGAAILPADSTLTNGAGTFSATLKTLGNQTITATDTADGSITGASNTIAVNQATSSTSLTSDPNPADYGVAYTFTATVTPLSPPSGPTPTGDVTFVDTTTGVTLGVRTLDPSGQAKLKVDGSSVAFLDAGLHTIKASYPGDGIYDVSSATFTETVNQVSTTTAVSTDHPSGSTFGEPVTYTATVISSTITPFGSVTFTADDGGGHVITMGTKALDSSGIAALTFNALPVGTFTVTAAFNANVDFNASSATTSETVSQGTTTSIVTTSKSPTVFGEPVTFTATVTANAPSTASPGGSVTFTDTTTGATLGTVNLVASGPGKASAQLTVSSLSQMTGGFTHTILAVYNTDGNYATSSNTTAQTVNPGTVSMTLQTSQSPSTFGQAVTFLATVAPDAPSTLTPPGSVTFVDVSNGNAVLGTVPVGANNQASVQIAALSPGTHTIQANYNPPANTYPAANASVTQVVKATSGFVAIGADDGAGIVRVFSAATHAPVFSFFPFGKGYTHGVRVAVADVNNDGVPDIIAGGLGGRISVFSGKTQQALPGKLGDFLAFGQGFTEQVFVAAGDLNGDGHADIVVSQGLNTQSRVRVFSGATGGLLRDITAFPGFSGGVRVAVGDVNGDGRPDLIIGAGRGRAAEVRVYNGLTKQLLTRFVAYRGGFSGGVFVAAADINGDGKADIITGAGAVSLDHPGQPGGNRPVLVYSGANPKQILASFAAQPRGIDIDARVAAADVNGDGIPDIVTSFGLGAALAPRAFNGLTHKPLSSMIFFIGNYRGSFVGA